MVSEFAILLPEGWLRLDLSAEPEKEITEFASTLVRAVPPMRQPAMRQMVSDSLVPQLTAMAAAGAVCVLLPIGVLEQLAGGLIAVSPAQLGGQDPVVVVQAQALLDDTARVVEVHEDLLAVRFEEEVDVTQRLQAVFSGSPFSSASPSASPDVRALSTRVRYLLGDPVDPERWVDVTFAVDHASTPEGREVAAHTTALFDAIVSTFRWVS